MSIENRPPQEPSEIQRDEQLTALAREHPEVIPIIEKLKDPELSNADVFGLIDSARNEQAQPEREGSYNEVHFSVQGVPGREIRAKWFKNGRVEIGGTDNPE